MVLPDLGIIVELWIWFILVLFAWINFWTESGNSVTILILSANTPLIAPPLNNLVVLLVLRLAVCIKNLLMRELLLTK